MATPATLIQQRYRIERLLGIGGFARVYLAHDERLGRPVALKELFATGLDTHEQAASLRLFEHEARMLAGLSHPGLAKIWDYFPLDNCAYLVMEYVPGATVRDLVLEYAGPLPGPLVLACGLQLCDVLEYLHTRTPPVIFRDLKPGNVMVVLEAGETLATLTPDRLTLKLIDFGIARLFKPEQLSDTIVIGTPGYASPEQYGQGQTDARSDIFSLGATLHHLASGTPPTGLILAPLLDVAPNAPPALARIIARATALNPGERYPTIDALRRDLRAVEAAHSGAPSTTARSPRTTIPLLAPARAPAPPASAPPVLLAMLALVLLGAVVIGAVAVRALGRGSGTASRSVATARPSATQAAGFALLPGATGQLVYSQCPADVQSCDVYTTDVAGQTQRALVGGGNNTAAALAPDGKQLAVTKNGVISVGPLSNPLDRQISPTGVPARYPAFSPDGRSLAFVAVVGGDTRLAVANLTSGALRYLDENPAQIGWITWTNQGLTYAATTRAGAPQDLYLLDDAGTARNLTNTPNVEEDFPAWSPDGRQLLFTASAPGRLDSRQIYRMNADGSQRTQLTSNAGPHTNAAWSPEGTWIAYVSRAGGGRFQIWAMRPDGREQHQLSTQDNSKFYLSWDK